MSQPAVSNHRQCDFDFDLFF